MTQQPDGTAGPDDRPAAERRDPAVPGVGGAPESSADGQAGLGLHAGIAVIASILSAAVTVVFVFLGSWPLAVVFAVVTLASLGALGWALRHRRRGRRLREFRASSTRG